MRRVVLAVCVLGIAGMIVASVNDNNGAALTFGLLTTAAVICLVVATAVTRPAGGPAPGTDERQAALVEELVRQLVAGGAGEADVRRLVGEWVRLGRGRGKR